MRLVVITALSALLVACGDAPDRSRPGCGGSNPSDSCYIAPPSVILCALFDPNCGHEKPGKHKRK